MESLTLTHPLAGDENIELARLLGKMMAAFAQANQGGPGPTYSGHSLADQVYGPHTPPVRHDSKTNTDIYSRPDGDYWNGPGGGQGPNPLAAPKPGYWQGIVGEQDTNGWVPAAAPWGYTPDGRPRIRPDQGPTRDQQEDSDPLHFGEGISEYAPGQVNGPMKPDWRPGGVPSDSTKAHGSGSGGKSRAQ